ncbi:hypothetical protein IQ243_24645 [Nostocales cyanobacterium LEGE 11386]|nr:hypothetical protein [Nostocales cyanobacterium LEGE 11386]
MTHPTYTQQALSRYTLPRLKRIAAELGVTPTGDKRASDTWLKAIITHQSTQLQRVDGQATAQAVAPEELTPVAISFYDHEYYCGDKLVAAINYDHADFVTQPWLVVVNGEEIHRADTWAKCHNFITWHHKDGSLPVQNATETPCTTGNEVMAQIFTECEKFGFDILDDGIYRDDEKLGKVGCSSGKWWFARTDDFTQQHIFCDSALEAVWWLSMVDTSLAAETKSFLDKPIEQLTGDELQRLLESEAVAA